VAIAAIVAVVLKLFVLGLEIIEKRTFLRPQYRTLTPEATSGIFSRWLFSWQLPLFRIGYARELGMDDLFFLDKHLGSRYLQTMFRKAWKPGPKKHKYTLLLTVFKSLKMPLLAVVFPRLCFVGFTFAQPFLIEATLDWSERPRDSPDKDQGYGLIGAAFLIYVGIAVCEDENHSLPWWDTDNGEEESDDLILIVCFFYRWPWVSTST
jgi:ATP-binding cassette subfamily C (CFTR/MRP) protein 1